MMMSAMFLLLAHCNRYQFIILISILLIANVLDTRLIPIIQEAYYDNEYGLYDDIVYIYSKMKIYIHLIIGICLLIVFFYY